MNLKEALVNNLSAISTATSSHFSCKKQKLNSFKLSYKEDYLSVIRTKEHYHSGLYQTESNYCFILPLKGRIHLNGYSISHENTPNLMAVLAPRIITDYCIRERFDALYLPVNKNYFDHQYELLTEQQFSDIPERSILQFKTIQDKITIH